MNVSSGRKPNGALSTQLYNVQVFDTQIMRTCRTQAHELEGTVKLYLGSSVGCILGSEEGSVLGSKVGLT